MRFLNLLNSIKFFNSSDVNKEITFYSEGKQNWPFLENLVLYFLKKNKRISYLTSSNDDPAFSINNGKFFIYNIGSGFSRNWIFKNVKSKILIMTVPGLEITQIKKSKYKVHYIYIPHSLASLHGIYPKGSFNYYNSIFCSTPYHVTELKKIISLYNLKDINIVKYGYPRLDILRANRQKLNNTDNFKKILIAPSWGNDCLIESHKIFTIMNDLLSKGYIVTLRPHPETLKSSRKIITKIKKQYLFNNNFIFEDDINKTRSIFNSDLLITDWSGIAFEYYIISKKPVIFVDVKQKLNNIDFSLFNMRTKEDLIREKIGIISSPKKLINNLRLLESKNYPFYIFKNSTKVAANEIKKILHNI